MLRRGRNKRDGGDVGFTRRTITTLHASIRLELRGRAIEKWLKQQAKGKGGMHLSDAKVLFSTLAPQSSEVELNALLTYLKEKSNRQAANSFISCGVLQTFASGDPRAILRDARAIIADLRRTPKVQYNPLKELAPLIQDQAEALRNLQVSLGVTLEVESDVPSFLVEVRQNQLRFQAEYDARKAVRCAEVSAVNGKMDSLSLLEVVKYRERMKVQHACRLLPVSKGHGRGGGDETTTNSTSAMRT